MLEKLGERREKLLVMLAMLSFRITEFADARMWFSTLRLPIPGKGNMSLVHVSSRADSSRILSALLGAKVGTWLVDMCDCDRVTEFGANGGGGSGNFCACVFLMMTCAIFVFEPRVAAR
jgi:hypothetical protein